jgi:hypothetical protein
VERCDGRKAVGLHSRGYITFKVFFLTDLPNAIRNITLFPCGMGREKIRGVVVEESEP